MKNSSNYIQFSFYFETIYLCLITLISLHVEWINFWPFIIAFIIFSTINTILKLYVYKKNSTDIKNKILIGYIYSILILCYNTMLILQLN